MNIAVTPLYGIGDTLLSTPAVRVIKEKLKHARITYFTFFKNNTEILRHNPYIDKIEYIPALSQSKFKTLGQLFMKRGSFDFVLNFFPSNRVHYNIFAYLLGGKHRLGHRYIRSSFSYLNFLKTDMIDENPSLHVVEENLALLKFFGIKEYPLYPLLYFITKDEESFGDDFMSKYANGFFVGIHPGTSSLKNHEKRRWPAPYFSELSNMILKQFKNAFVFVFGGPEEDVLKNKVREHSSYADRVIAVRTNSIRETAAIMKHMHLFITNDSGLMHLAAALQIPTVSIFGPTNPVWVKPWMVPHRVVRLGLPCSPCFYYSAKPLVCKAGLDFACLTDLKPDIVFRSFNSLYEEVYSETKK